jgi:hypothetical protein
METASQLRRQEGLASSPQNTEGAGVTQVFDYRCSPSPVPGPVERKRPLLAQAWSRADLFEQYVRMHKAASSEPVTSERNYLIWHAGPQGFGNRLRGLLSFLLVALNKVLYYIVWDEPVHHVDLLESGMTLMLPRTSTG